MKKYNDSISYEIKDNGYEIYLDGKLWITQYEKFSKPMDKTKSYEENCLMQIAELTTIVEPQPSEEYTAGYDQAVLDMIESGVL